MREGIAITAFTQQGRILAEKLSKKIGDGTEPVSIREEKMPLGRWTEENFPARRALIFIGACGIAVRTVAPWLKSKAEDPAVIVMDETGKYVISLVSGHLGGANELAQQIAQSCGAQPVITTATDLNQAFAIDVWAKSQQLRVLQPERIRNVSGKILRGETVTVASPWEIMGQPPEKVRNLRCDAVTLNNKPEEPADAPAESTDAVVTVRPLKGTALSLVPQSLTLGIGCRRGTPAETIEMVFQRFCKERQICPEAFGQAASIELKAEEEGLLAFCRKHHWPVRFFSTEELESVPGTFSGSDFVKKTTGVDNVCERSAVRASGGTILEGKYAAEGVTFAAALVVPILRWNRDGNALSAEEQPSSKPIVIFSGTAEGRELSERLAEHGAQVTVCVASEYGREIQGFRKEIRVLTGPFSEEEKEDLLKEAVLCVDATHPYASHITDSVRIACEKAGVRYLRLQREASSAEQAILVKDAEAAVAYLKYTDGNILLTTGAKELPLFCGLDRTRLFPRILPTAENLKLCEEWGIPRKNVIAMQGPFTREMNAATIRQYQISCLVSKDGGIPGGFPEKVEAVKETGIDMVVLQRPEKEMGAAGAGFDETLRICLQALQEHEG